MVTTDWGRAGLIAVVGLLLLHGTLWPGLYYPVTGLLAVAGLLFSPAITAVFPRVVPPEHLTRANGVWSATLAVLNVGAYAVGGGVVALVHPSGALLLDAATFVISGALLAVVPLPAIQASPSDRGMWAFLHDSVAGVRDLWHDRYLRRVILIVGPMNMVFGPLQVFSLVFSRVVLHGGPVSYGAIEAASGLGSVAAGLTVGRVAPWLTPPRVGSGGRSGRGDGSGSRLTVAESGAGHRGLWAHLVLVGHPEHPLCLQCPADRSPGDGRPRHAIPLSAHGRRDRAPGPRPGQPRDGSLGSTHRAGRPGVAVWRPRGGQLVRGPESTAGA